MESQYHLSQSKSKEGGECSEKEKKQEQFLQATGHQLNPFSINQQSEYRDSFEGDYEQPEEEERSEAQRGGLPANLLKKNSISSEDLHKTQRKKLGHILQIDDEDGVEKKDNLESHNNDVLSDSTNLSQNLLVAQQDQQPQGYIEYLNYDHENVAEENSQDELEEYQLQELEQNSFRRCFVRKEYCFFFVVLGGILVYVYFLFEQSIQVYYDQSQTSFCKNVSKWTFSLAVLLSLVPLYFIIMECVTKHRYRHNFSKDAFLSVYEQCGSKFLVFMAVVIGTFLSVYLFSEKSSDNNCKVLVNLFQFYLFIFWLCLYLIIRAVIETSPEILVPDSEILLNSI